MQPAKNKQRANAKNTGRLSLVYGKVTAIDAATTQAKITDQSTGKPSPWLEVIQLGSAANRDYWMPDIDDWAIGVLAEESETGFFLGGYYPATYPPPVTIADKRHVTFEDGTVIEYDRAENKLLIDTKGSAAQIEAKTASGNRLEFSPEGIVTMEDGKGASMIMQNGTIAFDANLISFNAMGMSWQIGNADGNPLDRSWTWNFDGTDGNIVNAIDFTIEGKTLTTLGAIDTDGDRLTTSGWN